MNDIEFKSRVVEVQNTIIFSITRVNYLLQMLDLINGKNRIIFRYQSFYAQSQRDMISMLLIAVRQLAEDKSTHNLRSLIRALHRTELYKERDNELNEITLTIENLLKQPIVRKAVIIASTTHAHNALKRPKEDILVKFVELRDWLQIVGEQINRISGIFWNSSVVLQIPESEGKGFASEMKLMERAEIAGEQLLRIDPEHYAVKYADELLNRKARS